MELYSKVDQKTITFKTLDELIPSTITALFNYEGELNLDAIFRTLTPEIKDTIDEDDFGVTFLRYKRETRGFKMKEQLEEKDYFKKSVTISVLYKNNNISIKLAENIFHICGLKSIDSGYEVIDKLTEKIQESQKFVTFIKENRKKLTALLNVIRNKCIFKNNKVLFPFTIVKLDYQEQKFIEMIFKHANYVSSLEWYVAHLEKLLSIEEDVIIKEHKILSCVPIMRNYIYSLGRPVNRIVLALLIKAESTDFIVKYNNSTQYFVRVKIPFTEDEMNIDENKKNKKRRYHHFLIHKTGTITQSGRDLDIVKDLFTKLMFIINKHYNAIINMNMDFLLDRLDEEESV